MRIALISPPLVSRYVHSIDEPLNLLYLAAQLKSEHEVIIVDSLSNKIDVQGTIDILTSLDVDLIGISLVFTGAYKTTLEICSTMKKIKPEAIVVLGGNTATFMAEELIFTQFVDAVVIGEGDLTITHLVKAIAARTSLSDVKGIVYRAGTRIINTGNRELVENLDMLPYPARDVLTFSDLYPKSILTARGCAYGCPYCSTAAFWGKGYRVRSINNILSEIDMLNDGKLDYFSFADDCFTLNPQRAKNICRGLENMRIKATWSCTGRLETMSESLIASLSRAGCRSIFFGVESGSKNILAVLRRKYSPYDVEKTYNLCIANDIRPYFSFIVGLPFETKKDLDKTFALIQKLEGVENGVHMLTPFPGTPIVKDPEHYQVKILPHHISDLDLNSVPYMETSCLSAAEIEDAYQKAVGFSYGVLRRVGKINANRKKAGLMPND